jgi:hypothetical protein
VQRQRNAERTDYMLSGRRGLRPIPVLLDSSSLDHGSEHN